jgi:hypothetical protein
LSCAYDGYDVYGSFSLSDDDARNDDDGLRNDVSGNDGVIFLKSGDDARNDVYGE